MTQVLSLLSLVLSLVGEVAPAASTVAKIIQTLEGLLSVGASFVAEVTPAVKNIIEAIRSKDGVTKDQLDSLDVLEKKWDDAFDAAAAAEGVGADQDVAAADSNKPPEDNQ